MDQGTAIGEGNTAGRRTVRDLRDGDVVQGTFAVRRKDGIRDYRSRAGRYFFFDVGDRTGDMVVKFWGGDDPDRTVEIYRSFGPGDVVFITGVVQEDRFEDRLIISMSEASNVLRHSMSEVRSEDFLPSSRLDLHRLMERVLAAVSSVQEPHLRALLDSFFSDEPFVRDYRTIPSAVVHHHNYLGGNLEHVVGVLEVCEALCRTYDQLDRDLLVTGALLHDIGKIGAYSYGTSIDMTDEGKLIGHAVLGEMMVWERMDAIEGFPKGLAMRLGHMMIKHMGSYEDIGPRGLRTLEAMALHLADNADAQVKEFLQEMDRGRAKGSGDWHYSRSFKGPIYLK